MHACVSNVLCFQREDNCMNALLLVLLPGLNPFLLLWKIKTKTRQDPAVQKIPVKQQC